MTAADLRRIVGALPVPLAADPCEPPAGSTVIRSTACTCTGRRPSAGHCPACHFVADWVPVEYAAAFVALANHADALVSALDENERLRTGLTKLRTRLADRNHDSYHTCSPDEIDAILTPPTIPTDAGNPAR